MKNFLKRSPLFFERKAIFLLCIGFLIVPLLAKSLFAVPSPQEALASDPLSSSPKKERIASLEEEYSDLPDAVLGGIKQEITNSLLPASSLTPYQALARIPQTISEFEYASGNWFGGRSLLKSYGIEPSISYVSDSAGNPVGGKHPGGFTYCDAISFNLLFKTEPLLHWKGGNFVINGVQRDGNSLSKNNIKNIFPAQQVYSGPANFQNFHFYEMYFDQKFADTGLSWKLGRFVAADDFDTSPLYWLYMNRAIDGRPYSLTVDAGFSGSPNAVWATRLKAELPESTILRTGIYQVTKNSVNGLNMGFYPSDGVMMIGQYEWSPEFYKPLPREQGESGEVKAPFLTSTKKARSDRPLPGNAIPQGYIGHYWMGGYYSTYEYPQFNSKTKASNDYGIYWHADQVVYHPNPLTNEGLALWSVITLAPQQNLAMIPFQANAGVVYTGLIPGRTNDFTMLGCSYGDLSNLYAQNLQSKGLGYPTYELVYEAGYRVNVTKYLYFQPDIQWIVNPGGTGSIPNVLVLGLQIGCIL